MNQIGHIEILRTRVYNLDAECRCSTATTVVVEPGKYPLYSDGMTTFWVMRAVLNKRGAWRLGDGMFMLNEGDRPSDIEVMFPTKRFGPDEWRALMAEPMFAEGHPEQRARLLLEGAA